MTALDTTNLRATFTPNQGSVFVRASVPVGGGTGGFPGMLLGILESSTVVARLAPMAAAPSGTQNAASQSMLEFAAVIPSVTVAAHTWDLAYGVETVLASTNIQYGGPNDTAGADAYGGATFEVWDTASNYLGAVLYDPSTAANTSTTSLKAMTAFDTTNMRITFTAPASGKVFWRQRFVFTGTTSTPWPTILLGILESSTVVARKCSFQGGLTSTNASGPVRIVEASGVVTGVGAGSHSWDAAHAIQLVSAASGSLKWGGPNNTTANDAWGAACFELWAA